MPTPRVLLAAALALSVVGAGGALAAAPKPKAPKLGPNLVLNPSFEESTSDAATANGIPVLPVAWSFEGASVLFDYNQRVGRTGKRHAAISGALGGGTQICDGSSGADACAPNPAYPATGAADAATQKTYSIRPYWVTEEPIAVTAGKTYRFAAWAGMPTINPAAGTPGQGAATQVRWYDAAGKTLSITAGDKTVKDDRRWLGFRLITADLKAPAGAAGAQLMLGHTDYTHTGSQVAFDDVSFQTVG